MGGKSSNQSSQNTRNEQYSQVNDGTFAGANNVVVDESDRGINDSYNQSTDDSFNTVTKNDSRIDDSYNQSFEADDSFNTTSQYDYSQSFSDDSETDNSIRIEDKRDLSQYTRFEDSRNLSTETNSHYEDNRNLSTETNSHYEDNRNLSTTRIDESDNSVQVRNEGDFAGVTGDIQVLDGGAIEESFRFARESAGLAENAISDTGQYLSGVAVDAIAQNVDMGRAALQANLETAEAGFNFARGAVSDVKDTAQYAGNAISDAAKAGFAFTDSAIKEISDQSAQYAQSLAGQSDAFALSLGSITQSAFDNAQKQITSANAANAGQLEEITNLAKTTTTGGAAMVAESSQKQVLYMALAIAVIGGALMIKGR